MRRGGEERLVTDMIALTRQFGRYVYRRISALLRDTGWYVNDKLVERLREPEGLKANKTGKERPPRAQRWLVYSA